MHEEMTKGRTTRIATEPAQACVKAARSVFAVGLCIMGTMAALLAVAGIGATTAGCVVNEPESPTRGVVVNGPPPPSVREERPAPPSPKAVWVQGYWHWTGMQYAWIPGHWDAPPPGASWNAPVYSMRDGRYFYESGGWRSPSSAGNGNVGNSNALR